MRACPHKRKMGNSAHNLNIRACLSIWVKKIHLFSTQFSKYKGMPFYSWIGYCPYKRKIIFFHLFSVHIFEYKGINLYSKFEYKPYINKIPYIYGTQFSNKRACPCIQKWIPLFAKIGCLCMINWVHLQRVYKKCISLRVKNHFWKAPNLPNFRL